MKLEAGSRRPKRRRAYEGIGISESDLTRFWGDGLRRVLGGFRRDVLFVKEAENGLPRFKDDTQQPNTHSRPRRGQRNLES